MKYSLLILIALIFVCFGCGNANNEVKEKYIVRSFKNAGNWDSVYLWSDGTLRIIENTLPIPVVLSCPPRVVLIIDDKVIPIVGDTIFVTKCKYGCNDSPEVQCEELLKAAIRDMRILKRQRDSLQKELDKPIDITEPKGKIEMELHSISDAKWEMISGPNSPTPIK